MDGSPAAGGYVSGRLQSARASAAAGQAALEAESQEHAPTTGTATPGGAEHLPCAQAYRVRGDRGERAAAGSRLAAVAVRPADRRLCDPDGPRWRGGWKRRCGPAGLVRSAALDLSGEFVADLLVGEDVLHVVEVLERGLELEESASDVRIGDRGGRSRQVDKL